jgi:hypothetical protein
MLNKILCYRCVQFMEKALFIILALALIVTTAACGGKDSSTPDGGDAIQRLMKIWLRPLPNCGLKCWRQFRQKSKRLSGRFKPAAQ